MAKKVTGIVRLQVPAGQAILRFSITALHERAMLVRAADALATARQACRNRAALQARGRGASAAFSGLRGGMRAESR